MYEPSVEDFIHSKTSSSSLSSDSLLTADNRKRKFVISFPCVSGEEAGCQTFPALQSAERDIDTFLKAHPNSVGARFVKLLQKHLHAEPSWERDRLQSCEPKVTNRNYSLCFMLRWTEKLQWSEYEGTRKSNA